MQSNKIKLVLPKSIFGRNILTVTAGNFIAQAIPLLAIPFLTRIYSPSDMGIFALYTSLVIMLGVLSSGKYDLAIMLPKGNDESFALLRLCTIISILFSVVVGFIIFILFNFDLVQTSYSKNNSRWYIFVPIGIVLSGLYQALRSWHNKMMNYKMMAIGSSLLSLVTITFSILIGFYFNWNYGLIYGYLAGLAFAIFYMLYGGKAYFRNLKYWEWKLLFLVLKKYNSFPKNQMLASSMNIGAKELPKITIEYFLNASSLGIFYLAQRVLGAPIGLISASINEVFFRMAIDLSGNRKQLLIKFDDTAKKLFFLGIIPAIFVILLSPLIFELILGESWRETGELVAILTPFYFIYFVVAPLNSIFIVYEKHRIQLIWQACFLSFSLGSLVVGCIIFPNILFIAFLYSSVNIIIFLLGFYLSRQIIKDKL